MDEELAMVLDRIATGVKEGSYDPVTQVAFILERSSRVVTGSDDLYEVNLTSHLLSLRLNDDEQKVVVERLCSLIQSGILNPGLFWAVGKASPRVLLGPLLHLLRELPSPFDPLPMSQALFALDNCIIMDRETHQLLPELARYLEACDPRTLLRTLSTSEDRDVAALAQKLLDKLARHQREGGWHPPS